jgi:lysophospholipase L1-like esterase
LHVRSSTEGKNWLPRVGSHQHPGFEPGIAQFRCHHSKRPGITLMVLLKSVAVGFLLLGAVSGGLCRAAEPECTFPHEVTDIGHPLSVISARLDSNRPLKIVALGSSSTAGAGASKPEAAYPSRLQERLSSLLGHQIIVLNRGRNGDRVGDMLSRMPIDVLPEAPEAVVWQVGTNALLTDLEPRAVGSLLLKGMREISAAGTDLIVMDPQYAPKVLIHRQAEELVGLLGGLAVQTGAGLFRRFQLMRFWHDHHLGFDQFLSPDQLHMNDWSYDCLANALAVAIVRVVRPSR